MPYQLKSDLKVVKLIGAGRKAAEAGRLRAALASFNAALAEDAGCAYALFYRAQISLLLGDQAGSRRDFIAVEEIPVERLIDYQELDNLPPAKYPQLLERTGGAKAPAWEWILRSFLYRTLMENDAAVLMAQNAVSRAPKDPAIRAFMGRVRVIYRFPHEGAVDLAQAVKWAPKCGWIRAWLGEARRRQGRMAEALKELSIAVRLRPGYALAHVWRGAVLSALRQPKKALADFDCALGELGGYFRIEDDKSSFVNYTLGWALHQRSLVRRSLGDLFGALGDLHSANQINSRYQWVDPMSVSPKALARGLNELNRMAKSKSHDARVLTWRGMTLLQAGRPEEAFADLDAAAGKAPRDSFARLWRGRALSSLGRTKEALREFSVACRLDKNNAEAHAWRGGMFRALSLFSAAEKAFTQAIRLDSISAWTYAWRGENRMLQGRLAAAQDDLTRALAIYPGYAQAYVWRGKTFLGECRLREARKDFKKALELDSRNADARHVLSACR